MIYLLYLEMYISNKSSAEGFNYFTNKLEMFN